MDQKKKNILLAALALIAIIAAITITVIANREEPVEGPPPGEGAAPASNRGVSPDFDPEE